MTGAELAAVWREHDEMDAVDAELTTYRRADRQPIAGEWDFVMDIEWFDGYGEPTLVIEERWVLAEARTFVVGSSEETWCDCCDADVTLPEPRWPDRTVLCADCAAGFSFGAGEWQQVCL